MKLVALTSAALLAATTAFAGNFEPVQINEPAVTVVPSNEGSLGGSGAWLVPVIAVLLVAGVVAANNKDK